MLLSLHHLNLKFYFWNGFVWSYNWIYEEHQSLYVKVCCEALNIIANCVFLQMEAACSFYFSRLVAMCTKGNELPFRILLVELISHLIQPQLRTYLQSSVCSFMRIRNDVNVWVDCTMCYLCHWLAMKYLICLIIYSFMFYVNKYLWHIVCCQ